MQCKLVRTSPIPMIGPGILPLLAAVTVILVGILTLTGWLLDISVLKTVFPGFVTMKANTAIGFVLAGLSLLIQTPLSSPPPRRRVAQGCAMVVALLGLFTLAEHVFAWDFGIDHFFFRESQEEAGQSFPGRMAPTTALNLVLLGLALMFLDARTRRGRFPAEYLTLAAAGTTMLGFIGYFYGVEVLYRIPRYTTIALHTVLAFWVLCAGILLSRPRRGIMAIFTSSSLGGVVARRMLIPAILLPLLGGWLRVMGERAGFYGLGFGTAIFSTALILAFTGLVWWAASALNRMDAERQRNAEIVRQSESRKTAVVESALDCILTINHEGILVEINSATERTFGYSRDEMLGHEMAELIIPHRFREAHRRGLAHYLATREGPILRRRIEITALRKDGAEFPVELAVVPIEQDGPPLFTATLRDITDRKNAERALAQAQTDLKAHADTLEKTVAERTEILNKTIGELEAFSYSLSHDLRAPLRAIRALTEIVLEEEAKEMSPAARDLLQKVVHSAQRMDRLVQDVLSFSQVSRQEIQLSTVDVEKLVRELIQERAEFQSPKAEITIANPLLPMRGHEASLTQCVTNLLSNAVKFVARGVIPQVRIHTDTVGDNVRLWFEDNGIGIDKVSQAKLFGLFQRQHAAQEYEGSGIGLSIVKKAIERMGGRVGVESAPGRGSRFWIDLPKAN
jgi:PAS domain S-box-containing protein